MAGLKTGPASALAFALALVLTFPASPAAAQGRVGEEVRVQFDQVRTDCSAVETLANCATTLITGHPARIVFAGVAPGNGPAFGASFGTGLTTRERWRLHWNTDAVRTLGGSWRAGTYVTFSRTPPVPAGAPVPAAPLAATVTSPARTTITAYAQRTSIQDVSFYGLGNNSDRAARSSFGMSQAVVGANLVAPLAGSGRLRASLLGDANARVVSLRSGGDTTLPATAAAFDDATAPGLTNQPRFLQLGGGVRVTPSVHRHFNLNYLVAVHRFAASGGGFSFTRWRVDLDHDIGLFRGPDEPDADPEAGNACLEHPSARTCLDDSRDLGVTIHLRAVLVSASPIEGAVVPFYFQPTLGGADIRGQRTLAAFGDYRFRAPHTLLFQQSLEHSVWGPVSVWVQADHGMVALSRNALGSRGLKSTLAIGATARVGGIPTLTLSFATGGGEGNRLTFSFNAGVLGSVARPALD